MFEVKEIMCKSMLNKSKISDLTVNPYNGCSNGCKYCYVRFMKRHEKDAASSAGIVEAKINAPTVLLKQIKRMRRPAGVMMSSVCDAWQQAEEEYKISRKCLEILIDFEFPVSILTKRALVLRDLDIIERAKEITLGVTITTFDAKAASLIEPGASSPEERALIFKEAKKKNIRTYLFFGPVLPVFSDNEDNIREIFKTAKENKIRSVCIDKLNYGATVWSNIKEVLSENYPGLVSVYRRIFLDKKEERIFLIRVKRKIYKIAREVGYRGRVNIFF